MREVVILHRYLTPLLKPPVLLWHTELGPQRRPQGRRVGVGPTWLQQGGLDQTGRAQLYATQRHSPAPPGVCHIYKYIHKYITYNSGSGRQASHRGSADRVMSQNSRKGTGLPGMCSTCSLLPKGPPSPF